MPMKLTKKTIDRAIAKGIEAKLWDSVQRGLCARVRAGSGRCYLGVEYRGRDRKKRWQTIGEFGATVEIDGKALPLTIENGRRLAGKMKALDVATDRDRRAESPTLDQEAARWLAEQVEPHNSERTAALYAWMMAKHILPALGSKIVTEITRGDCQRLHNLIGKANGHRSANHALCALAGFSLNRTRQG
jgi:Phage integrase, N-terminal SAM-like domain